MLAGRLMRAPQCIDDVAMHCADGGICDETRMLRIRDTLVQFMRCDFDAEDHAYMKFCDDAAAMLA